ncbi:uncharacterized protein FA14DRAFT_173051 [Meira miltonrushii]|uniref:DUF1275 domain protein n=1 Tax=Meira miltonrushii TaxID=1280837 RepID=A0A316V720_9BASI|nr:uncharacterized protein FA14DRAFT_173051 [Meira miltonrushii]PWN33232.1 hypothetical protein FA14DRAFT_173051 [Meira miltonrushii]
MANEREPLLSTHTNGTSSRGTSSVLQRWKASLTESVDPNNCHAALTWQCVIAGAADAAAYSQTGTWVGFMTGNVTQLTIALVTTLLHNPSPPSSISRIWLSSTAVLGFIFGALIATWIDSHFHGKHRGKLVITALARGVVFAVLVPFLAFYGWSGWYGMGVLFVMATNMGSMAVCATKLGSTPYSTTVVFTASMASLFSDPLLPLSLSKASQTRAKSLFALIFGGACSQVLMILTSRYFGQQDSSFIFDGEMSALTLKAHESKPIGSAFAIGLVAIFEFICAYAWFTAKTEQSS